MSVRRFAGFVLAAAAAAGLAGCRGKPTSLMLSDSELVTPATLVVGDPAPPLAVSEWVRGDPVGQFEHGRVYVVDWWATWCGSCLASMGRTSALQDAFGDRIAVIAITAADDANPRDRIRDTARRRADTMRMRIAIDDGDTTAARFLRAARETSIPRTFIVDGKGRLAWIGHPQDAEPVVRSVLAGTWDIAEAAATARKRAGDRCSARKIVNELVLTVDANDDAGQLVALEKLAAFAPEDVPYSPPFICSVRRVELLVKAGRSAEAVAAAEQASKRKAVADDPWGMAELAVAVRSVDRTRSDECAIRAMRLLEKRRAEEKAGGGDDWDQYLRGGQPAWDANAYDRLASIAAADERWADAVTLERLAVEYTDPRSTVEMQPRKSNLARYQRAASPSGSSMGK